MLRYPLLILTAILVGSIAGFAYSYAPLHRAKNWKIEWLEERLANRTAAVEELERELGELRTAGESEPTGDEMNALRAQLAEANGLAAAQKQELAELERQLADANGARDSWQSKHAQVASRLEQLESQPASESPESPEPEPLEQGSPVSVPASRSNSLPEERFPD